jgi:NADH:ubiquinone oxidoreductase subunit 4 (subunit M)
MTLAHFHLAAVHLPIVAIPLLVLILFIGIRLKKQDLSTTALVGIALVALITIPIFLTGEAAEELVEHLPSISEDQVEFHEFAATVAFVMVALSGILSFVSLVAAKYRYGWFHHIMLATLVIGVSCSGTLVWAANEGGKIRHLEVISPESAKAQLGQNGQRYYEDDDDNDDH